MSSASDSDPYRLENVSLFEAIYGKNLISLGGSAAIDNMFTGLELKGLKALDLGFGLGGVAYYLAQKYQMEVAGVEIHPWMAKYAQTNAPKNIAHLLHFDVYDMQGKIPFKAESFDLVYSKGVLNHVRDKANLFRQVLSMLKPNGLFVIADWIYPEIKTDSTGPLVYETQESYQQVLQNAGFRMIEFRDDSKIFLSYVKSFLENLTNRRDHIEQEFGKELFSTLWKQHQELTEDIQQGHKFATRIIAQYIYSEA